MSRDPNLARILAEAIKRQRERVKRLEDFGQTHRDFNAAQKVLSDLIGQARAVQKQAQRTVDRLTPEEQREVIVSWFDALPLQQQKLLLQELTRIHNGERAA